MAFIVLAVGLVLLYLTLVFVARYFEAILFLFSLIFICFVIYDVTLRFSLYVDFFSKLFVYAPIIFFLILLLSIQCLMLFLCCVYCSVYNRSLLDEVLACSSKFFKWPNLIFTLWIISLTTGLIAALPSFISIHIIPAILCFLFSIVLGLFWSKSRSHQGSK